MRRPSPATITATARLTLSLADAWAHARRTRGWPLRHRAGTRLRRHARAALRGQGDAVTLRATLPRDDDRLPQLAVPLTAVIGLLLGGVVLGAKLGVRGLGCISLFPVAILDITSERIALATIEESARGVVRARAGARGRPLLLPHGRVAHAPSAVLVAAGAAI